MDCVDWAQVVTLISAFAVLIGGQAFWIARALDRVETRLDRVESAIRDLAERVTRVEERLTAVELRVARLEPGSHSPAA
jgi:hypothetical protein